jgi:hypothetical protein
MVLASAQAPEVAAALENPHFATHGSIAFFFRGRKCVALTRRQERTRNEL